MATLYISISDILRLPLAVYMLGGPSKCLKQMIQIKPNRVKNPNWREANQLAIYKRDLNLGLLRTNPARVRAGLVCYTAVFSVVTQCSSPLRNVV